MNRSTIVVALLIGTLGLLIVGLGVSNWRLGRRVAGLEMVVAQGLKSQESKVSGSDQQAIQVALQAWRQARSGEAAGMDEDEAAALVEAALDEALDRKTQEATEAAVDRYMEMAEESIQVEVEDLQEDFNLSDDQVARTIDLTVQGMIEGYELQEDLKKGDISVRQAKEEGEIIKQDYYAALIEILGEAAFEGLGERFYPGKGWD